MKPPKPPPIIGPGGLRLPGSPQATGIKVPAGLKIPSFDGMKTAAAGEGEEKPKLDPSASKLKLPKFD